MHTQQDNQLIETSVFTTLQRERYNAIYHIYGDDAARYIPLLKTRGENSWKKFYEKAIEVNKAKGTLREYYDSLTAEFSGHELLTENKILQIVSEIRADLNMEPVLKQMKTHALNTFYKLFLFEDCYGDTDEPTRGPFEGYVPVLAIRSK